MKKTIILSILAVTLFSCCSKKTTAQTNEATSVNADKASAQAKFEVLKQDEFGGRETAGNLTIRSQQELNNIYAELGLGAAPKIDFTKRNVVAIFMGQQRSGGYSISIDNVTLKGSNAEVIINATYPEKGAMVTTVMTAPYCIATIPYAGQVKFFQDPPPMR